MSQIRVCTTIKVTGLIIPDRTLRAPRTTGGATNPVLITLFSTSPDLETEFPTKLISTRGSDTTRQKPPPPPRPHPPHHTPPPPAKSRIFLHAPPSRPEKKRGPKNTFLRLGGARGF